MTATLLLADGRRFDGLGFGAQGVSIGEVVFNTAMYGYQEILTDPSYRGQHVLMTAPEIGNYGCNAADAESRAPQVSGLIVRSLSPVASNHRSEETLDEYLKRSGVVAISGLDTRSLTRSIRDGGHIMGAIVHGPADLDEVLVDLRRAPGMAGQELATEVTCSAPYEWRENTEGATVDTGDMPHVVAFDFGAKRNILRLLVDAGFRVTVVPANTDGSAVAALDPAGVFFSNGPGDPAACTALLPTVRSLMQSYPCFGICLGHQLMALARGATTFKMKFGHRGGNHPVRHLASDRIEITSQNHGFAVVEEGLPEGLVVTHRHLNDATISGIDYTDQRAFSVQYHPESAPGPHDSRYLFAQFHQRIAR
jgi:carbamoyl-phosphate synthase small subunit